MGNLYWIYIFDTQIRLIDKNEVLSNSLDQSKCQQQTYLTGNKIIRNRFRLALEYIANKKLYVILFANEAKMFWILDALYATGHVSELFVKQHLLPIRAN